MNNYNVKHVAKAALAVLIENVIALTTFLFVRLFCSCRRCRCP